MTIELGFAQLDLDDVSFGIVDVPGHERFVRTMVAGATGVDVALIIVAADDSVMPQTIEHVEILNLLGVTSAVVAITKCDLADDDMIDLVELEIRELLAGTPLEHADICRVSSATGSGLDALKNALHLAAGRCRRRACEQPFRLPVDRVFSVAGRGTVVTGSVVSGGASRGDLVDIWPSGASAKIRDLQTHHRETQSVHRGQRAAINLQGVDKSSVARGDELAASGRFEPTRLIDAHVTNLASRKRPIKNNARLRLCIGTREVLARAVILTAPVIEPGDGQYVQLRISQPIIAMFGQRFILRDENAARTTGGGVVLRVARKRISTHHTVEVEGLKVLHAGQPIERVHEALRSAGFSALDENALATAAGVDGKTIGESIQALRQQNRLIALDESDRLFSAMFVDAFLERCVRRLAGYHAAHPDEPGCPPETVKNWIQRRGDRALVGPLFDRLLATGQVRRFGRHICLAEFAPKVSAQDEKLLAQMLDEYETAGFQPPLPKQLATSLDTNPARVAKLIKLACAMGELIEFGADLYLHRVRYHQMRAMVREMFMNQGPFSVAQLREALSSSRKFAVPLAEFMDRSGITRRKGDVREWIANE